MSTRDEILEQLKVAQSNILNAIDFISAQQNSNGIVVKPGDNLLSLIDSNPAGTEYHINNDFIQSVGTVSINKPCKLISERGTLIGTITAVAPDISLIGLILRGDKWQTILTTGLRTIVESCSLIGNDLGQHRGIAVNSTGVRIRNTRILNIFMDIDTQAIGGWDGTKDLQITGCDLEASGENIMFGGADSASEEAMPRDILVENCHMFKKLEWREDTKAKCKNLFELKAVNNFAMRNSTFDYSFADGQIGYGWMLTVRNPKASPWSNITNVLLENNIINHMAGGISILGRDDARPSGVMDNVIIKNNKFQDINPDMWGLNGREFFISGGPKNLVLDGNSFDGVNLNGLYFDQPQFTCDGLVITNNFFIEGKYGIFGTGAPAPGKVVLSMYAPGYQWINNTVKKSGIRNIEWPDNTIFV